MYTLHIRTLIEVVSFRSRASSRSEYQQQRMLLHQDNIETSIRLLEFTVLCFFFCAYVWWSHISAQIKFKQVSFLQKTGVEYRATCDMSTTQTLDQRLVLASACVQLWSFMSMRVPQTTMSMCAKRRLQRRMSLYGTCSACDFQLLALHVFVLADPCVRWIHNGTEN